MAGRLIFGAVLLLALLAPDARAQTQDTRNRALIVLDASNSMNEDAGNGGTRLDAAKQAVSDLVDKLPPGAPIGLRVYGAKVSETSREEACKDTELVIPVGPLKKDEMRGAVNALQGKGRTPIGNSLLATPDDLGAAEGRRSVVLVSDGGDNCAPPNPCKAAEEVAKRGLDLSISVVGLQVNERVRKQLECIARVGGGSYVDVQDAGKLGEELAALLSRAFRSYEPAGTEVTGTPDAAAAPGIGAGLFQDVIAPGEERFYALDVPEGKRAVVSVTAIPPHDSTGYGGLETKLLGPDQQPVASQSFILHGGLPPGRFGTTESQSLRSAPDGPPGRYALSVAIDNPGQLSATEIPLEIGVQFLAPGEEVGLTRNPGELATPTPTPTATPTAAASAPPTEDDSDLSGWLVVLGVGVLGLALGFVAAAVLGRRSPA